MRWWASAEPFCTYVGEWRARMRRDGAIRLGGDRVCRAWRRSLFLMLFGIIETGVLFFANSTLQNATADTARLIRTGQLTGTLTADALKTQICSELDPLISTATCKANLQLDLRSYTSFSGTSYGSVTKSDGSIDTSKLQIQGVAACSVVLMRSFYPWTIMTPLMQPLLENMPGRQVSACRPPRPSGPNPICRVRHAEHRSAVSVATEPGLPPLSSRSSPRCW